MCPLTRTSSPQATFVPNSGILPLRKNLIWLAIFSIKAQFIWGYSSLDNFINGVTRNTARFDAFLEGEEKISTSSGVADSHNYNGFITTTGLKGTRHFETILTSSIFQPTTIGYEINDETATFSASRAVHAAYFYPYSSHQLSVLRKSPTLIIDLDKSNELPNGVGSKGFVLIPENTHPKIKANLDEILLKAGYATK